MSDSAFHFVFSEPFDADAEGAARACGRVTVLDHCDETTLAAAVVDCDALLVRTAARVTREVLERTSRLRVVGRGGAGLDNIDVEAAHRRGVAVVYTPDAATEAVADLTIGLMIALLRGIARGDAMVRAGEFVEARRRLIGRELGELTVGVVGMGRIGRAVAKRCRYGFGSPVVFNDIVPIQGLDFEACATDKAELYRTSDIVSLHVPLTDETRGMVDAAALAGFKAGSILVNTARGALIDGTAVAEALRAGALGGAALDVFDVEPPVGHPLIEAPNTLLTPHLGARTHGALGRMNQVVEDVIRVLQGMEPRFSALA